MTGLLLVPYMLLRGPWRSIGTFFAGHVVATLGVALVILPGWWYGWASATLLAHAGDVGPSAGLAACAAGLAVAVARHRHALGVGLLAALAGAFVFWMVAVDHQLPQYLADVEHLLAIGTGVVVELHWARRDERHAVAGGGGLSAGPARRAGPPPRTRRAA